MRWPSWRPSDVADGHGLELVAGVGVATWVAHVFADLVGEHVRHSERLTADELRWSLVSGTPILVATVLPGVALGLGRLEAISDDVAIWIATTIAIFQMVGVGATVGVLRERRAPRRSGGSSSPRRIFGLAVTAVKVQLGH